MPNVVRVFRATVKPGKEDEFGAFLIGEAIPILRRHRGLVSVRVGLPRKETPRDFLMITTWSSVESLAEFSGADWREAVIDPREAPLLDEVSVHHYEEAEVQEG